MRSLFARYWIGTSGNVAVEFGLLAPVLVMALLGMVDFGFVALEKSRLTAAARTGLQVVLQEPSDDVAAIEAAIDKVASDATTDVDIECGCADGSTVDCDTGVCPIGAVRKWVNVTVTKDVGLLVPWPGWDDPMTVEGEARARVQ